MNMIETYRGVVYPTQMDHMGHMNVQWYIAKFDEATWQLCSAIGITSDYMREKNKGMAALEQVTRYISEVRVGEILAVKSRVDEINEKIIKFTHVMYNVETTFEVARTELVGLQLDTQSRKAYPLPADIIKKCKKLFGNM